MAYRLVFAFALSAGVATTPHSYAEPASPGPMTWGAISSPDGSVRLAEAPRPTPVQRALDGWPSDTPKPQIDCTCRPPDGGRLPIGAEICVERGGSMITLRCEMSLNIPFWRQIGHGCAPTS